MTLAYLVKDGSTIPDPIALASAPFASDQSRQAYVNLLVSSNNQSFATLESISVLKVPLTEPTSQPTAPPSSGFHPFVGFTFAILVALSFGTLAA